MSYMNYVVVLERVESNVYTIQENEHEGDQVELRKATLFTFVRLFSPCWSKEPAWHLHSSAEHMGDR